jgi:hypothetical protein
VDLRQVTDKLEKGVLPSSDFDRTRLIVGGLGDCAACDNATTPADPAVQCEYQDQTLLLHPDCYVLWEQARGGA